MLHKCANPACSVPFLRMTEGKLFLVQMPFSSGSRKAAGQRKSGLRRIEHYWMCDQCARQLTIVFDASRGMLTVPLPAAKKSAVSESAVAPGIAAGVGNGRRAEQG